MPNRYALYAVFAIFTLFTFAAHAQITVAINSGNPSFPFPQFLAYKSPAATLGNLATRTPHGLCHAEMEQSIRDAYQIMMNRAMKPGGGVGGIDYILFRSTPSCSEGSGYAMLAAAAMADKTTFDGLWLWIHDNAMNKVRRYSDGKESSPGYQYSQLPGWQNDTGGNSAADGDFDIGLALLCAYKQWGEFMGINDFSGNPISYKNDAIAFLKALTDTLTYAASGKSYISGDIGLDGYIKGGDTWHELTDWANDTGASGLPKPPSFGDTTQQHIDYAAPAYFHQFAGFLAQQDSAAHAWNIKQFRRAEASSDWLVGQLLPNPRMIPHAGWVSLSKDNAAAFSNFNSAEDFRLAWRTILNYVWHGNPASTWDPAAHQVKSGAPNTYERDVATRYAKFLWDSRQSPWNNPGISKGISKLVYWGPSVVVNDYDVQGKPIGVFFLNWIQGAGSPSAVAAQDFNLMAEMYRQCEIEWDVESPGDGYLTSVPRYYHGWFRLFGMLVLSGNYQPPLAIAPAANMKVYCDVDKTYAVENEEITYTIIYRNYGSLDAQNVIITDTLHTDVSFVSCTGGGAFDPSSRAVTWKVGTVPGFKSATGAGPTAGSVSLKVAVSSPTQKQYANTATIRCDNGAGWTSDEYPNAISPVMKRNLVDIVERPFDSTVSPLRGGRPGVRFAFSRLGEALASSQHMAIRMFHDAQEPYIGYGNFRFSYFLYDSVRTGLLGQNGNTNGWNVMLLITEGIDKKSISVMHQNLHPHADHHGKWNQRVIIQFSPSNPLDSSKKIAAPTNFIEYYYGLSSRIHRGATTPLRIVLMLSTGDYQTIRWDDDWSWSAAAAGDELPTTPITPDVTDPDPSNPGIAVNKCHPKLCDSSLKAVDNILIEEWDGCVWRRAFGDAVGYPVAVSGAGTPAGSAMAISSVSRSLVGYSLPRSGKVVLQLVDLRGRIAATLVDSYQKAGAHSVRWDTRAAGSAVYIFRLISGNETIVKKCVFAG